MNKKTVILIAFISIAFFTYSQTNDGGKVIEWSKKQGLEYRLKAGFNIGGTSPMPLPQEIRAINGYNPLLQISAGSEIVKWVDSRYGIFTGISLENKGMRTDANVKNYKMKMVAEAGGSMEGRWTGNVVTEVQNAYLTVPLGAVMKLSPRWEIKAGGFVSYKINGRFTGYAYEGYLRDIDPTGSKIVFEGDTKASYDFSNEMNAWQYGVEVGGKWQMLRHLSLFADFSWGFAPILKSSFETIPFGMYPIYLNMGFAYNF